MKYLIYFYLFLFCSLAHAELVPPPEKFEKLKKLVGDWHGILPDGNPITVSYQIINGGMLMESYRSKDPRWWNMSSVYLPDNGEVRLHHYCGWGNHSQMTIDNPQKKQLDFDTERLHRNQPDYGYMHSIRIEIINPHTIEHHWVWRDKDGDTPSTITLTRNTSSITQVTR